MSGIVDIGQEQQSRVKGRFLVLFLAQSVVVATELRLKREIVFSTAKQRSRDGYQTKVRRCIVICVVKQSTNNDTSLMVTSSLCSIVHRMRVQITSTLWHTYLYTMASDQQPTSYRHKDTRNKMHIKRTTAADTNFCPNRQFSPSVSMHVLKF